MILKNDVVGVVRQLMMVHEELRYHRNRFALVEMTRKRLHLPVGVESVTRAQRKIWSAGECIPHNKQELAKWLKIRKATGYARYF